MLAPLNHLKPPSNSKAVILLCFSMLLVLISTSILSPLYVCNDYNGFG